MKVQLITLIQHKLDTSSLSALAAELAARLDATVVYGYQDDWLGDDHEATFDFVALGYAGENEQKVYKLTDHQYLEKLLGITLSPDGDDYLPGTTKEIKYTVVGLGEHTDQIFSVYKECLTPRHPYLNSWGGFCAVFMVENCKWINAIHGYRKSVRKDKESMGTGEFVLHLPDGAHKTARAEELFATHSWADICAYVYKYRKVERIIDFTDWFTNGGTISDIWPGAIVDDMKYFPEKKVEE